MLHFVTSYMKQNESRKQTLESAQYGLEIWTGGQDVWDIGQVLFSRVHGPKRSRGP